MTSAVTRYVKSVITLPLVSLTISKKNVFNKMALFMCLYVHGQAAACLLDETELKI